MKRKLDSRKFKANKKILNLEFARRQFRVGLMGYPCLNLKRHITNTLSTPQGKIRRVDKF